MYNFCGFCLDSDSKLRDSWETITFSFILIAKILSHLDFFNLSIPYTFPICSPIWNKMQNVQNDLKNIWKINKNYINRKIGILKNSPFFFQKNCMKDFFCWFQVTLLCSYVAFILSLTLLSPRFQLRVQWFLRGTYLVDLYGSGSKKYIVCRKYL